MEENNMLEEVESTDEVVFSEDGSDGSPSGEEIGEASQEEETAGTVSGGDVVVMSELIDYDLYYDTVYNAVSDALEEHRPVIDGQSISSKALAYFQGILGNQKLPVDYVIYSVPYDAGNGQLEYAYCMAYGQLDLAGEHFTGNGTIVTFRASGAASVEYLEEQTISIDAPKYYSRSNLGNYSGVIQYDYSGLCLLLFVIIGGVVWYMRKLFGFKF